MGAVLEISLRRRRAAILPRLTGSRGVFLAVFVLTLPQALVEVLHGRSGNGQCHFCSGFLSDFGPQVT